MSAKAHAICLVRMLLGRISSISPAPVGGGFFFVHPGGNAKWLCAWMALFSFCSHIKLRVARYYIVRIVRKLGHFCHAVTVLYFLDYSRGMPTLKKRYRRSIFFFFRYGRSRLRYHWNFFQYRHLDFLVRTSSLRHRLVI